MTSSAHTWFILFVVAATAAAQAQPLYTLPEGVETRWSSFENPGAEKGKGGAENKKAKGHPSENISPKQTTVLVDAKGAGIRKVSRKKIGDDPREIEIRTTSL